MHTHTIVRNKEFLLSRAVLMRVVDCWSFGYYFFISKTESKKKSMTKPCVCVVGLSDLHTCTNAFLERIDFRGDRRAFIRPFLIRKFQLEITRELLFKNY